MTPASPNTPGPLTITVLGSGTSHGIPMIGCDCPVCTSTDPHDARSRPSILVQRGETIVLIDTSPELRLQCLANNVQRIDAVLYTHYHADHVVGLDDLRRFNYLQHRAIPIYGQAETLERIGSMFPYVFDEYLNYPSSIPQLDRHVIKGPFEIGELAIRPIELIHGELAILGFRIGDFAYCTDVSEIPPQAWPLLQNLDVLMLDALRKRPHPTHFNIEQAIDHAHKIGARRTLFTHIAHELPHEETNAALPQGMSLAYDGMVIESR